MVTAPSGAMASCAPPRSQVTTSSGRSWGTRSVQTSVTSPGVPDSRSRRACSASGITFECSGARTTQAPLMNRALALVSSGPLFPLLGGYAGLVLYWLLRTQARRSASYRALNHEMGAPSFLERSGLLAVVLAGGALVALRLGLAAL